MPIELVESHYSEVEYEKYFEGFLRSRNRIIPYHIINLFVGTTYQPCNIYREIARGL